jgi:hypothetical protein
MNERAGAGAAAGVVTVFDRVTPSDIEGDGAVLYLAPPPGNTVCPSARVVKDASVVDWESGHPALGGLEGLQAVEAARAVQLLVPHWGTAIVTAASRHVAYPFLVVGEVHGRRRACLAAELPERLAASDAMPLVLLTLSTLRWLAEPTGEGPITLATGVPVRAAGGAFVPARGLRAVGDPPVVLAERAGVHRVHPPIGAERLVLASLTSDTESDVGREGDHEWPPTSAASATASAQPQTEMSWWLYAAAAALLVLEWLVWGLAR